MRQWTPIERETLVRQRIFLQRRLHLNLSIRMLCICLETHVLQIVLPDAEARGGNKERPRKNR